MNPPRDYPIDGPLDPDTAYDLRFASDSTRSAPLTVAALYDRHAAHLPITDAMIADACRTLYAAESCPL